MARIKRPEEFASKRREILDAAHRLVFTKGFGQMSIRDILDELQISSGAFHHYFGSREALLDGYIERMGEESDRLLLPVIHDPQLSALEKLQGFFDALDRGRVALSEDIARIWRVWYTDANAVVRVRVDDAVMEQRAPLIAEIVRQGVREGVFAVDNAATAGEVVLSLVQTMGDAHAKLLLSIGQAGVDVDETVERIVAVHAAYMQAIERVLNAPPNTLKRTDAEAVRVWVKMLPGG